MVDVCFESCSLSFGGAGRMCYRIPGGNFWLGEEGRGEGTPPGVPLTVVGLSYIQDACAGR